MWFGMRARCVFSATIVVIQSWCAWRCYIRGWCGQMEMMYGIRGLRTRILVAGRQAMHGSLTVAEIPVKEYVATADVVCTIISHDHHVEILVRSERA